MPEGQGSGAGGIALYFLIIRADFLVLAEARFDLLTEKVAHIVFRLKAFDDNNQFRLVR